MTHDELKDKIEDIEYWQEQYAGKTFIKALRAVVELHRPAWASDGDMCLTCSKILSVTSFEMTVQQAKYPCTTIQAIEKELING